MDSKLQFNPSESKMILDFRQLKFAILGIDSKLQFNQRVPKMILDSRPLKMRHLGDRQ
jgi:hypothetical protein